MPLFRMKGIIMGLAASQAKLLSITSRLSDNELRSQTITAAKMALANQSSEASRKYINSLNATEFNYRTYDADGQKVYVPLTGSQLTTYGPLKNQYAMINTAGQVLLSERDATNYENSETLNDFLQCYGITPIDTGRTRTVTNPEYVAAYNQWQQDYTEWMSQKPDANDPIFWEGTNENPVLFNKFVNAVRSCGCWQGEGTVPSHIHVEHILAKMIDYDTDFVAYPGTDKEVTYHKIAQTGANANGNPAQGGSLTQSNTWSNEAEQAMVEVRDLIKNNQRDPELWQDIVNLYYESVKTDGYLNYIIAYDADGNPLPIDNGQPAMSNAELVNAYYDADENNDNRSIIERLKMLEPVFDEELYNTYLEAWEGAQPDPITIDPTIEEIVYEYSEPDMAQWYVNLWHLINGESDYHDGTMVVTNQQYGNFSEYGNPSTTITTTSIQPSYYILEDGLMNSQQWLKYALETGGVSLKRVDYAEITTLGTGLKNAEWNSIIYTNALDINEETDDRAIAVAEAEYEQKQREIENKDKQYDSMLKLLDTEHNALQTEYDSVKSVISKNTERTLKIYSA